MEIKAELKKPYTEKQRIDFIFENNHKLGYEIKETDSELQAWGLDKKEELAAVKLEKINFNDILRDEALNSGVEYKEVIFDSDTDQKVNLLAIVSTLDDEASIVWYGKDNNPLECTKEDLTNIGSLITQLHVFCWNKNAEIKAEIEQAQTLEELEAIEIDYSAQNAEEETEETEE